MRHYRATGGGWRIWISEELFVPQELCPTPSGPSLMRCLERDVGTLAGQHDWKEVQANRGFTALLKPRALFKKLTMKELPRHFNGKRWLGMGSEALLDELAGRFQVCKQAARIRLGTLKLLPDIGRALPSLRLGAI